MRKYKQSIIIKLVFGIIVFSFIGTIFLVWGRGDKGVSSSGVAAKVNGSKITMEQYQKNYYRLRSMYEQLYGRSLTPDLEKQFGLKKQAIDTLVNNVLIAEEAKRMGIKVTKDEIATAIAAVPSFQKDGAFDFQQYTQMLKASRMTVKEFESSQESELKIKKAMQQIKDKAVVSDDEALQNFKKQRDKVVLSYVAFSPDQVQSQVKLTDADLSSYLQGHQEQFKTPEQVSISYCVVDPAKFMSKITVNDEEAEAHYRKYLDRYQVKGDIRPFSEVKDFAKADALKAKAAREAYEQTADALNKNLKGADLKAAATALGVKVEETPVFSAATPPPALAGEAEVIKRSLALKEGELGGPVETAKGIYLLKVREKKPAAVPPLDQIKPQVQVRVLAEKAKELAKKKAEETLAAFGKGDAAIKAEETGPFGFSDKGDIPKIGASSEIMEAAFALTSAAPVAKTPFKIGEKWYAIKLRNRIAADTAEFQKTMEQIKQTLLPKKQQDATDAWLKELKAKAKIVIDPSLLAE
jgi:peptidyl-prolyl cis-trans isomerase D